MLAMTACAPVAGAADLPPTAYRRAPVMVVRPAGVAPTEVVAVTRFPMEVSRFTGQPLTVVYNDPGSFPGAVDPGLTLVPLSPARRFDTQAVYPRGY